MDSITRYINFYEIIKRKNAKYPFAIFNTYEHNEAGTHWWSFLDIKPKSNLLLFDSHRLTGFKYFIVDNDTKIIDELLYNFEKCKLNEASHKITLCAMKFSIFKWEKLPHTKKEQLTKTAQDFFHLLYQFAKLKKSNEITIVIVENDLQELTSDTCGIFQLYFYKNLFDPSTKSKIINHKNLNKKTIEMIINEIFSTDIKENKYIIKKFREENL